MRDLITHPYLHSNGMDAQLYHTVVYIDIYLLIHALNAMRINPIVLVNAVRGRNTYIYIYICIYIKYI